MYKYITTVFVWLIFATSSFAADLPKADPASMGFDPSALAKMDAHFDAYVNDGRLPGYTTLVARSGKVVHARTYGQQDTETGVALQDDSVFRIYSMTKPITGTALMMLWEEGKFQLDDPVSKYIPAFGKGRVFSGLDSQGNVDTVPAEREMTIRDLMRHTGGLSYGVFSDTPVDRMYRETGVITGLFFEDETDAVTPPEQQTLAVLADKLGKMPLLYQPGKAWVYSLSTDVQGRLVEILSGQTLDIFFAERIFKPLGMTETGFQVRPDQVDRFVEIYALDKDKALIPYRGEFYWDFTQQPTLLSGGGGLVSTTADYWRFAQMIANGGELGGKRLLKPETVKLMRTDQLPTDLKGIDGVGGIGFGLNLAVVKDPAIAKSSGNIGEYFWGGMAGSLFWVDPTTDVVVIMMVNILPAGVYPLRSEMRDYIYSALKK